MPKKHKNDNTSLNDALRDAIESNSPEAIAELIAAGAETEARFDYSTTPLSLCIELGRRKCANMLLSLGADPNANLQSGRTPTHKLAHYLHNNGEPLKNGPKWIRAFLLAGADFNLPSNIGKTPLDELEPHSIATYDKGYKLYIKADRKRHRPKAENG